MVDTHTHIYFNEFKAERKEIVDRAKAVGVRHFVLPNVDEESLPLMKDFYEKFPDISSMAIGLHPTEVKDDWQKFFKLLDHELSNGNYVGIGEVGVDLYWDKTMKESQLEAFEWHLRLAEETKLPVIIHSREAFKETVEVIEKVLPSVPLIFHSFTGSPDDVALIRNVCNPFFGINGVVTYKNAQSLRDALPIIGIENIVLETDSPYLSPVPHRGKRNESSYVAHVRDKVAEVLSISKEDVDKTTDRNAGKIFRI
ncbi:MAG: TatD family hydrolase [Muribaculaceae bacterium]|nr:TatD family hydrolase [Muribaculaceae bacterium]